MKSQQRGLLIAVILLLIMGGFIYGIKRGEPPTKPFQYNGFNILPVKEEGYRGYNIEVYINDIPYPESLLIRYDPKSVEDIPIEANLNEIIQKKVVFVAIDPTDTRLKGRTTVAAMELNDNIEKFFNRTVNGAFTIEQANYTVRTCENTGGTEAVIKLQLGEENKIFKEGSCVVVEGKTEEDLIRGADRLFLRLLGIMPK